MNDKFFELPIEKQNRIINAAYKVFSQNSYKKAPMSEIADESGISKALLFHYFTNNLELYLYLWNKSVEQIHEASLQYAIVDTSDFFEILHRSLLAKCSVVRDYPCLFQFSSNAYYEQEPKLVQYGKKARTERRKPGVAFYGCSRLPYMYFSKYCKVEKRTIFRFLEMSMCCFAFL